MQQQGFSLIELMVVIAIIGILVAVAMPSYQNYTRRAHYTEIVQAAAPYKMGVEECYQTTGDLSECNAGIQSIPAAINSGPGLVDSIEVKAGEIRITPHEKEGIKAEDTYLLSPEINAESLQWKSHGGGVDSGYAH